MKTKVKNIRIIDDDKIEELYTRMTELILEYDVTIYEALGVLECVKTDVILGDDED